MHASPLASRQSSVFYFHPNTLIFRVNKIPIILVFKQYFGIIKFQKNSEQNSVTLFYKLSSALLDSSISTQYNPCLNLDIDRMTDSSSFCLAYLCLGSGTCLNLSRTTGSPLNRSKDWKRDMRHKEQSIQSLGRGKWLKSYSKQKKKSKVKVKPWERLEFKHLNKRDKIVRLWLHKSNRKS